MIVAFETVAEAPDGVKRLRELVLQLAVRGKLVAQDAGDEAASVLLERTRKERERRVQAKIIRRQKALPPVSEDPFESPPGWAWARVDECFHVGSGLQKSGKRRPVKNVFPYLRVANVQRGVLVLDEISEFELFDGELEKYALQAGDLLVVEGNGSESEIGRCARWTGQIDPCVHQNHLIRCRPLEPGVEPFVLRFLNSPLGMDTMKELAVTTSGLYNLSVGKIRNIVVPVPPVAEQHRIVARVDELMGLLDRLDAARMARDTTRAAARDAALAALREADTPVEVEVAWNRFAERMDDLLCDPADIDPLRQAVLQLAVRGKLVPQDPADEPASVLLERIAAEKSRLYKQKAIRKPKVLALISREEIPFDVPDHWPVVPFGQVFATVFTGPFGTSLKKSEYVEGGTPAINPQNLRNGEIAPTPQTCVGPATLARLASFQVRSRDLVVARRGEMGRCAMVQPDQDGWLCGTGSLVLRPPTDLHVPYTALYLRSPWTVGRLSGDSVGSTMLNLNQRIMLNLPFGLPPLAEQQRIVARVDALMALLDRLADRLATAQSTRTSFAGAAVHHLDA